MSPKKTAKACTICDGPAKVAALDGAGRPSVYYCAGCAWRSPEFLGLARGADDLPRVADPARAALAILRAFREGRPLDREEERDTVALLEALEQAGRAVMAQQIREQLRPIWLPCHAKDLRP